MYYLSIILLFMTMPSATAQTLSNPKALFNPTPYAFSHVATVPAAKTLVFVAGQGGEKDTLGTLDDSFSDQVRQSLFNISLALKSQGLTLKDVVKLTTLVVDHDAGKLRVIAEQFRKAWPNANFPVNTLIPVPKLAIDGMLVEIDAIAVKP